MAGTDDCGGMAEVGAGRHREWGHFDTWHEVKEKKDMPWVEERCLFVRRMPDGSEFYFYGMMISSNVVRMSLYHKDIGWWHIVKWKYERGC